MMIFFPVFPWRHAGFFFEGTGKGKWILISAGERHAGDRDIRDGQKLPGVMILAEVRNAWGVVPRCFFKKSVKVAAADMEIVSNICHSDIL